MKSLRILGKGAAVLFLLAPACVVRLNDRNAPLENGGVSGPNADCSAVQVPPEAALTGPAMTKFVGRYDLTDPKKPRFDWSGNSMNARFEGTEVTWGVEAQKEQVFEVIIDGRAQQVILPEFSATAAPVFSRTHRLAAGVHEITVVRSSEAVSGISSFVPFTFVGTQLPTIEYARRIEFIGDSILCGYGNEGPNATCPYDVTIRTETDANGEVTEVKIPETENVYLAYGAVAARQLSAEATILCFSGKGVVLNYREQGVGEGAILNPNDKPDIDALTTIPDYYRRTVATDHPTFVEPPTEDKNDVDDKAGVAWPFGEAQQPQVVVINIGTNDFARDANQDSIADGIDLAKFRAGYRTFVDFVRSKRLKADIFLAVPPMVTDLFPLDNARTNFRAALRGIVDEMNNAGDTKVYFIELIEMGVRYGLGCDYHPNLEVHRIMAEQVAGAIKSKTCWSTASGSSGP